MRVTIKNLGPIREASVDLSKRLIVLTGPNNTGKTWLAWCVYGLTQMPARMLVPVVRPFAEELLAAEGQRLGAERTQALWNAVLAAVPGLMRQWLPVVFAMPARHFADTVVELASRGHDLSSWGRISAVGVGDQARLFELELERRLTSVRYHPRIERQDLVSETSLAQLGTGEIEGPLAEGVWRLLLPRSLIFPAERAGIQLVARELAAERTRWLNEMMVRRQTGADEGFTEDAPLGLPLPISDFHAFALQRGRLGAEPDTLLEGLAESLQAKTLAGRFVFGDDGQIALSHGKGQPDIPLASSSAAAKSLAQIVRLLQSRQGAQRLVIVDEPEQNLHPDSQCVMARVLATFAARRTPVMISTHSDYVLREINHCIMAAHSSPEVRAVAEARGYDAVMALRPEQVGAYFVHDGVAEALVVSETGFQVPSIDAVIDRQSDDAQALYAAIDASDAPAVTDDAAE